MTGSNLAPIVIPIVAMLSLAAWIVMIFYANSHPFWRNRTAATPNEASPRRSREVPTRPPGSLRPAR